MRYRKHIVPLIFIFLFSEAKAEFLNSAFLALPQKEHLRDTTLTEKKYYLAEKLYEIKEYSKALKYSHDLLETTLDPIFKIKINLLIGNIFKDTGYDSRAGCYYYKALKELNHSIENSNEIEVGLNLDELKSRIFLQLAALNFRNKKSIDSAIYYYEKAINVNSISEEVIVNKGKSYGSLSSIYALPKVKNLEKAKDYVNKAIEIHLRIKDKTSLAADYGSLANIYVEEHDYKKAKNLYKKALFNIEGVYEPKAIRYKEILYDNLAWCLYKLKDYKAYDYLDESISLKDSLQTLKHKKELAKLDLKYNMDILRKEEENKRDRLKRNSWIIGTAGIAISLLLLFLVYVYKLRQNKLMLALSKKELEQQRALDNLKTESQVKIINATIDGKETERKQIAETLHDNVSALLSSANMHLKATYKHFDGELPLELRKTQNIILEASQQIRDLSHNLVSSVLLKFGLEYAIKDVAKKYSNSSIKIHTVIGEVNRYSQDFEMKVFNIIQELLNNIFKHSNAKTAYVVLEEEDEKLLIIVKDDGRGFDANNELNKGIGLTQIKARIRMLKGVFKVESEKGNGAKIFISIPVIKREEVKFS